MEKSVLQQLLAGSSHLPFPGFVVVHAALSGFRRRKVRTRDYAGIVPDPSSNVTGILAAGLNDHQMAILDGYAGSQFTRQKVRVKLLRQLPHPVGPDAPGEMVGTETYVWKDPAMLEDQDWDYDRFATETLTDFMHTISQWRTLCPVSAGRGLSGRSRARRGRKVSGQGSGTGDGRESGTGDARGSGARGGRPGSGMRGGWWSQGASGSSAQGASGGSPIASGGPPGSGTGGGRQCKFCGKERPPEEKLFRCARCRVATYCSIECQRADWQDHQRICPR